MNIKFRKFGVISLVAAFGILVGLNIKDLIDANFMIKDNLSLLIKPIMYFALMAVMFYEWIKILRQERNSK